MPRRCGLGETWLREISWCGWNTFFFGHVAAAGFARELLALGRGWGGSFEGLVTKNSKQDCLVGCCMGCLFGGKYRWG